MKEAEGKYPSNIVAREVDPDIKHKFKELCQKEGITMNQKLKNLIEEAVIRGSPKLT